MEMIYDVVKAQQGNTCNGDACGNANLGCNTNTDN